MQSESGDTEPRPLSSILGNEANGLEEPPATPSVPQAQPRRFAVGGKADFEESGGFRSPRDYNRVYRGHFKDMSARPQGDGSIEYMFVFQTDDPDLEDEGQCRGTLNVTLPNPKVAWKLRNILDTLGATYRRISETDIELLGDIPTGVPLALRWDYVNATVGVRLQEVQPWQNVVV